MTDLQARTRSRKEELTALAVGALQVQGFSALGLRGLAEAADLKAASLYNHFASKDDLVLAALEMYSAWREDQLAALELEATGGRRIHGYLAHFVKCLADEGRLCLYLMLAVERATLPSGILAEVERFARRHEDWLGRAWDAGLADGSVVSRSDGSAMGAVVFGALEGAMAFAVLQTDPAEAFTRRASALLYALGVSR